MESQNHKDHFAHQAGKLTLTMLHAHREFGVVSRAFMLNEHGKTLEDVRSRTGPFENYSEKELAFVEGRIYVELVERVCQLIEDFSSLCFALWNRLSDFPLNILNRDKPTPKKLLKELTDQARWFTILRYPNLDTLEMSTEDKEFLRQHYERNIRVLRNLAKILEEFRKIHWEFYTKHKHANPLVYGITKIDIGGEPTLVIPAFYDVEHPETTKGILMNYSMYKMQREIANTIIGLLGDLLDRAISFIERDGKPIIESVSYYKVSTTDAHRIQRLVGDYNKNIRRTPIEVKLDINIPGPVLRRFVEFYDNLDLGAFDK